MCDAFLVLAQAPGGLSCFFVPRFLPTATRNALRIQRLKDKLGNRSNASSEVEFDATDGWLVGEEGRGVATIIDMVNATRLDCVIGSAATMRQSVTQAMWHCAHRAAFGRSLIDQPLMQQRARRPRARRPGGVGADVPHRDERSIDAASDEREEALIKRLLTPVAKFWVTQACTPVVREAMECLGGNGYVEESILPRAVSRSRP